MHWTPPYDYTRDMHDTTATFETMSPRARWGLALFCIALGAYPLLLAAGVVEPDPGQLREPRWALGMAGVLFVFLGLCLPFRTKRTRRRKARDA